MDRLIAILFGFVLAGCATQTPPSSTVSGNAPSQMEDNIGRETIPQPVEYLFPLVPLYPEASAHSVIPSHRAFVQLRGAAAAKALAWYQSLMLADGWRREETGLPSDTALLFSMEGQYLSISGHETPHDQGSVLWFHLRTTKEITQDEAVAIAKETHRVQADWTATRIQDDELERYALGVRHPVWMVEAAPGNDAVWVDAITAEPSRIRQ